MKKKNTIPSAFEEALGDLGYANSETREEVTDMNRQDQFVDVEDDLLSTKPSEKLEDNNKGEEEKGHEDTSEIPEEVLNNMNNSSKTADGLDNKGEEQHEESTEPTEDDITEAKQVGALFDAVAESFGWNVDDIEEESRPVTVEGLTDYLREVVEQNSKPEYADERVQKLDEYIKNGGRFEDFYAVQQQELNYDTLDIEDEQNQRAVIREFLQASGYSEDQINNKIDRYESADMLEEEAEDALGRLKTIRQQQAEMLQREQEQARLQQEEQNKAFITDISTQINGLKEIRGIAIPKEDRKALFEYIFKQDANGMSQYQKDFNKNLTRNLIESAYFTMRADSFVTEAKKAGQTSAAQKLRQVLRHSSKNHTTFNADEDKQRPAWEIASKFL